MKLWQKVFLVTLVFVIIVVNTISLIVIQTNFQSLVQSERQQAIVRQEYLKTIISSYIVNTRLHINQPFLTDEDVKQYLKDIYLDQYNIKNSDILILDNKHQVVKGQLTDLFKNQNEFVNKIYNNHKDLTLIDDYQNQTYLMTGSNLQLEMHDFYIYTITDITELYTYYYNQLFFVQTVSFIVSGLLSLILLVIIIQLLKPLKTFNQSLLEIANGNYQLRLENIGSIEIKELSSHINIMAQSIEESTQKLQSLADGRKQFIDHLAHEMKTPLTSIVGFADILRVKRVISDEERREYASIILEETKRLQSLSTKLLELSTTKQVVLELENVSIDELFHDIEASVFPLLERKQIKLKIDYEDLSLCIDKALFKSLLYNLVDNAIKVSKENGFIEMRCYRQGENVEISVRDYGIGMSKENIDKVTEPFYMIRNSYSQKEGGTGIGLSLCVEIAKRHDAQLEIQSELEKGTCVKIIMKGNQRYEESL